MKVAYGGSNGSEAASQISDTATTHAGKRAMTGKAAVNADESIDFFVRRVTHPRLDTLDRSRVVPTGPDALSTLTR
jgi:hypothetical protein